MNKKRFLISTVTAVAVLLILSTLTLGGLPAAPTAFARDGGSTTQQRFITVVGEGTVSIKPDIAKTTIGVETVKVSVKEASAENQATLVKVLDALKALGIADKDLQTAGFNIYAEQMIGSDGMPQADPQYRYHVTNQVQVTIRDIETVGEVIDAAIEAGANSTYGVEFRLDDQDAAQSEARAAAIENANVKAAELAGLTNVTVGPVISVSEIIGNSGFLGAANAPSAYGLGGGGTPIATGELQLNVQIQVTYAIE